MCTRHGVSKQESAWHVVSCATSLMKRYVNSVQHTWSGAYDQHISWGNSVFYSSSHFGAALICSAHWEYAGIYLNTFSHTKRCLNLMKHPCFLLQTYLQSLTVRLEEMRVKKRDSEQWMHHRVLPPELRERVRRYDQYKWMETRGVDEESLVQNLPKDLRRDIKRHLCLNLVRRVNLYSNSLVNYFVSTKNQINSQVFSGSSVCKHGR